LVRKLVYVGGFGISMVVMGIAVSHYQFDLRFLSEPSWLSVTASLVLALLTAVYVLQTQGMLREMTKARKAEFLPHVKPSLQYPAPLAVDLLLKNVGKGPAFSVDITFGFQPSEEPFKHWLHPLLAPEESYSFLIMPSNFNELVKKYDFLVVSGTYKDVFRENHKIDEKINLKEVHKGWSESMILLRPSLERRLEEISKEVKRVGHEIRDTTLYEKIFPLYVRLGNMEIKQPPLEAVNLSSGGIHFSGKSLDSKIHTEFKKLKEGDIEEAYCNDRHGVIISGVYEIKKVELKEESVGQKVLYSFSVSLEYKR